MSLLIELNNVGKTYRTGGGEYTALHGVNFHLCRGEIISIIGTSGSGKSTLMNIIGFLDHCTSGNYYWSGVDVSRLSEVDLARIRNHKIGFVFQSFFLLPRLNALQNVMLPLFYRGESKSNSQRKALSLLRKVDMEKFILHKPNQLSGGQQQRVAIARALVGSPEVILADEPTGALDSKTGDDIMGLLLNLNQLQECTIVIVTHDLHISNLCNRVVALKDGNIVI